jgi:hypothetical protein
VNCVIGEVGLNNVGAVEAVADDLGARCEENRGNDVAEGVPYGSGEPSPRKRRICGSLAFASASPNSIRCLT